MLKNLSFILLTALIISFFGLSAVAAQTNSKEIVAVNDSKLAVTALPSGAHRVKEASVPKEIKDTLAKIVASGGEQVRQGNSEVIIWNGNFAKLNGSQMMKKLENVLQSSGWQYEIGAKQSDFVLFSLFRAAPERRLLVGFFVPSEDAFVFALTEMVRADAPAIAPETQAIETNVNIQNTDKSNLNSSNLTGKWSRSEGSGFIDSTGKTQYKAGATYSFEFFPDGTVEYIYDKDVLSVLQCRTKENSKARGTVNIEGDLMTIYLGAMNSVGSSTCETKNNFNKTLPASTVTKKFKIKKMDSLFRPDNPSILCFDGQEDNSCFEKIGK